MEWLTENWLWILLGIGFMWMLSRRGGMGCGMGSHSCGHSQHGAKTNRETEEQEKSSAKGSCH
jgi:hypothetical protein